MNRDITRYFVFLLLATATQVTAASELFLQHAKIVDPDAKTIRDGNILIVDGRIAGFPATQPAQFAGEVRDLGGRWVIPALTDMHTHSFGNVAAAGASEVLGTAGTAQVAIKAGVARFLDLFSDENRIFTLRNKQRTTGLPGAEILAAGPCLTATHGHCSEYGTPTRIVNTPEEARREVTDLATKQPDVVKVVYSHDSDMPTISKATLEAVIATARQHGLRTVVHIGTWNDVQDAVEAGATAVTHTPASTPMPVGLAAKMKAKGTYHIPTLAAHSDYLHYLDHPALLDSPLLNRLVAKQIVAGYRVVPTAPEYPDWLRRARTIAQGNLVSVATLARAGVPMLTGTDAGNLGVFQGYSVHRELALLVEAGLSPWEALAASTTNAGRFFGRQWGMAKGSEASLVVLDKSPIADIKNSESIYLVIHRGEVVVGDTARTTNTSGVTEH